MFLFKLKNATINDWLDARANIRLIWKFAYIIRRQRPKSCCLLQYSNWKIWCKLCWYFREDEGEVPTFYCPRPPIGHHTLKRQNTAYGLSLERRETNPLLNDSFTGTNSSMTGSTVRENGGITGAGLGERVPSFPLPAPTWFTSISFLFHKYLFTKYQQTIFNNCTHQFGEYRIYSNSSPGVVLF